MRILFISPYDYLKEDAISNHSYHLSRALSKLGCDIRIVTFGSIDESKTYDGIKIHCLKTPRLIPGKDRIFSLSSVSKIRKLCQKYGIEIVHGQSPYSFGYALARIKKIPYIVTVHTTSFGEIATILRSLKGSAYYYKLLPYNLRFISNQSISLIASAVEYKRADKVIAVSRYIASEIVRFHILPKNKVTVINNGVDPSFFNAESNISNNNTILFVGRLTQRKGLCDLIEAMPRILAEFPNAKLEIVGSGPIINFLKTMVKKLRVEGSVNFFGNINRKKLRCKYFNASVYAYPSLYEGFNLSILEAMAAGKPVVAARFRGSDEIINNGKNGILVEPENSSQLADEIIRILSNPNYGEKLANEASKNVLKNYTWDEIAKETLALYQEQLRA